jgi:hypothetical protein
VAEHTPILSQYFGFNAKHVMLGTTWLKNVLVSTKLAQKKWMIGIVGVAALQ